MMRASWRVIFGSYILTPTCNSYVSVWVFLEDGEWYYQLPYEERVQLSRVPRRYRFSIEQYREDYRKAKGQGPESVLRFLEDTFLVHKFWDSYRLPAAIEGDLGAQPPERAMTKWSRQETPPGTKVLERWVLLAEGLEEPQCTIERRRSPVGTGESTWFMGYGPSANSPVCGKRTEEVLHYVTATMLAHTDRCVRRLPYTLPETSA